MTVMALGRDYQDRTARWPAHSRWWSVWQRLVLRDCLFGVRRFSDLRQRLDVPRGVLATRADEEGLLRRRLYRPGREEAPDRAGTRSGLRSMHSCNGGERDPAGARLLLVACEAVPSGPGACANRAGTASVRRAARGLAASWRRPGPGHDPTVSDDEVTRSAALRIATALSVTTDPAPTGVLTTSLRGFRRLYLRRTSTRSATTRRSIYGGSTCGRRRPALSGGVVPTITRNTLTVLQVPDPGLPAPFPALLSPRK